MPPPGAEAVYYFFSLWKDRCSGERFAPLGMGGTKLLSDYFTDRKLYGRDRQTPLVCDQAGLLFVPGGTVADRAKITDGTKRILHIIFTNGGRTS